MIFGVELRDNNAIAHRREGGRGREREGRMGTGETNAITNYSMVTGELGGGDGGGQPEQAGRARRERREGARGEYAAT